MFLHYRDATYTSGQPLFLPKSTHPSLPFFPNPLFCLWLSKKALKRDLVFGRHSPHMLCRQGITGWQKWLRLKIKRLPQAANLMPADEEKRVGGLGCWGKKKKKKHLHTHNRVCERTHAHSLALRKFTLHYDMISMATHSIIPKHAPSGFCCVFRFLLIPSLQL